GKDKDALVAYYTVNYEGKRQETIPIVYGKDVSNWWYTGCNGPSRAEVAWKGANEAAKSSGATLCLYVIRWNNPEPCRRVVSIDFTSTNSDVAPFCVAMTVEEYPETGPPGDARGRAASAAACIGRQRDVRCCSASPAALWGVERFDRGAADEPTTAPMVAGDDRVDLSVRPPVTASRLAGLAPASPPPLHR